MPIFLTYTNAHQTGTNLKKKNHNANTNSNIKIPQRASHRLYNTDPITIGEPLKARQSLLQDANTQRHD